MLQASRKSGGCCDSSLRPVRRCAGTGMIPDGYGELNWPEVKDLHLRDNSSKRYSRL